MVCPDAPGPAFQRPSAILREQLPVRFWGGPQSEGSVAGGRGLDHGVEETAEDHSRCTRVAAVEPEGEFVKVYAQMVWLETALMRCGDPSLDQGRHQVDRRQQLMGLVPGSVHHVHVVRIVR